MEVGSTSARVMTPRCTGDLLRRLIRVRRCNASMRAAITDSDALTQVRHGDRTSWLRTQSCPIVASYLLRGHRYKRSRPRQVCTAPRCGMGPR